MVNAINDGVWDWNVSTGQANFSSRYYEMLGYKDDEFPATYKHWITLVHPDDVKRVEAELQVGVKSGKTFIVDVRLKKKDGNWLWTATRGKTIETTKDGSAIRMVGTLTDISDRKQIEEKLEDLRIELQNKFDEAKKLNDLMINRELKMVEMKNTIKELKGGTS
ncbi:MAG: PAS domain-containing protein [bacterium]